MIIEFFGKIGSGKSVLAENLANKNKYEFIKINSKIKKYFLAFRFIINNPKISFYLIKKSLRNSFKKRKLSLIVFNMARYQKAKTVNKISVLEENFLQAIFSILDDTSDEKEIEEYLKKIPKPDLIVIVDIKEEERKKRLKKRGYDIPEKMFGKKYGEQWEKNMVNNYAFVKEIISNNFLRVSQIENSSNLKKTLDNLTESVK